MLAIDVARALGTTKTEANSALYELERQGKVRRLPQATPPHWESVVKLDDEPKMAPAPSDSPTNEAEAREVFDMSAERDQRETAHKQPTSAEESDWATTCKNLCWHAYEASKPTHAGTSSEK